MNKLLKIGLVLGAIGLITIGTVFLIPWGNAKSEVEKTTANEPVNKIKVSEDVVLNDITEVQGTFISQNNQDKVTSEIMFHVAGPQDATGSFKKFTIELNAFKDYQKSSINVVIDPMSVYTANGMRDESIKGEGFFEAEVFPKIKFYSDSIIISDTSYAAVGFLSMLGVEKSLEINFLYKGKAQNEEGNEIVIFEGAFNMDRTNFGMKETKGIGNIVEVTFYTELVIQP